MARVEVCRLAPAQSLRWFLRAAVQGDSTAQYNLGLAYATGEGATKDDAEAVRWCAKAAEHGLAPAQNNLAIAYRDARGVTQDDGQDVKWFQKAAEQRLCDAQYNLGLMYSSGRGGFLASCVLSFVLTTGFWWSILAAR